VDPAPHRSEFERRLRFTLNRGRVSWFRWRLFAIAPWGELRLLVEKKGTPERIARPAFTLLDQCIFPAAALFATGHRRHDKLSLTASLFGASSKSWGFARWRARAAEGVARCSDAA